MPLEAWKCRAMCLRPACLGFQLLHLPAPFSAFPPDAFWPGGCCSGGRTLAGVSKILPLVLCWSVFLQSIADLQFCVCFPVCKLSFHFVYVFLCWAKANKFNWVPFVLFLLLFQWLLDTHFALVWFLSENVLHMFSSRSFWCYVLCLTLWEPFTGLLCMVRRVF